MHFILRGALRLGVRWKWVSVNAATDARPSSPTPPDPIPSTPKQAAVLLTRAWEKDPDWGCLLWVAMTTGARRGELCALRWWDVNYDAELLTIARSYVPVGRRLIHKDTKTRQRRRIAQSPESIAVLEAHHDRATAAKTRSPPPSAPWRWTG
jgi:integrase